MALIPDGAAERFIDLDGGRVRILYSTAEPGAGVPLLLIHGGGTDNASISWFRAFAEFGGDRPVYALDLPGFGETSGIAPLGDAAAMADFVARVTAELGLARVALAGCSMGGEVALNVALRHPELVEALILVAPGGLIPVFRNRWANLSAWLGTRLPDALLLPATRLANRFTETAVSAIVKDPDTLPPEALAEFLREARRPDAALGYLRYNQASIAPMSMRNNLTPVVDRIEVPALFFHGADDPIVDPAGSRRAGELMPRAELVVVPDCGHWAHLEAAERFDTEAHRFLAAVDAARESG